jgi:hypothetical protein
MPTEHRVQCKQLVPARSTLSGTKALVPPSTSGATVIATAAIEAIRVVRCRVLGRLVGSF